MQSIHTSETRISRARWGILLGISTAVVLVLLLGLAVSERLLDSFAFLQFQGRIKLWTQDYEEALTYFEQAALKQPHSAEVWFNVGLTHTNLEQWPEAIKAYRQTLNLQPDDAQTLYELGYAYVRLGNKEAANQVHQPLGKLSQGYANRLASYISLMK